MPVCKYSSKKYFSVIFVVSICLIKSFVFATDVEMPDMPAMPSMPTLSVDGSYYTPAVPMTMMGQQRESKKNVTTDEKTVISSGDESDQILQSIMNNDSTLTANDISTLYDSGLFTDLSSLTSGIAGINQNITANNSTNVLLQEILVQLNQLKNEQKQASPEEQEELSNNQKDSANFKQRNPSVLRFKINDYDLKESLVEVFLSEAEADGSFLFTADRRYVANNKTRTETFYLLFRAEKDGGASISYNVEPSVVQDYENKNSFIYKLSQIKELKAEKIGNLVVLRHEGFGLKVDLLLNIDINN